MCGRYVSPDQAAIERAWSVHARDVPPFPQNFNVVPNSKIPMLRADGEGVQLTLARWGLIPHWWKEDKPPRSTINSRSEEVAAKPMWRTPLSRARCLIPALGWYEWNAVDRVDPATGEIKKAKQPHYFRLPGGEQFCFAGLMSYWRAPNEEEAQLTCSILTQGAAESVADVHNRMPVILPNDAHSKWLDSNLTNGNEAIAFARDHAILEFEHYAISDRVNRPVVNDANLIVPL